jgi:hypothetical protein
MLAGFYKGIKQKILSSTILKFAFQFQGTIVVYGLEEKKDEDEEGMKLRISHHPHH